VSDYGLDDRAIGVRSPAGAKDFSSSLCIQTGSEAHPASCKIGTGGSLYLLSPQAPPWRVEGLLYFTFITFDYEFDRRLDRTA
jgi:hypothetical protein